jgi:uncharacterized membrane protein YbhN (UPF0104 family)
MRRGFGAAAGAAVGLAFLGLALRGIDLPAVRGTLAAASPAWLGAAVLALAAGYAARIVRWRELLRPARADIAAADCAGPLLAGFALNNLLPLRAGDMARAFAFRDRLRIAGPEVLGSLVAERVLDLGALVAFFAAGLGALGTTHVPGMLLGIAVGAGVGCGLVFVAAIVTPGTAWERLRGRRGAAGTLGRVLGALEILRVPRRLARLLALTLGAWACEAVMFLAVARSLALDLPTAAAPAILGAANLVTMIPGTPGHLGTFDFFARTSVAALGVSADAATAYAFAVHFVVWAPITAAGIVALTIGGVGLKEAVRRGREAGAS